MIHTSKIRIPANFVLVLPDESFDNFQVNGKDSLLVGQADVETDASHYSVRGKVYQLPEHLDFCLDGVRNNKIPVTHGLSSDQIMFYFRSHMVENMDFKKASVLYETPIEVNIGDIVYFNYQEHYNAYEQGRWIETELGEMMLMKYDQLICCHPDGDDSKVTMLNGIVLVEPITTKSHLGTSIYKKSGLFVADLKSDDERIKKNKAIGYVTNWGRHIGRYMEMSDLPEGAHDFTFGDLVVYNPKMSPPLQFSLHQAFFGGKNLVKIRRRDIFCILADEYKKELAGILADVHLN